MGDFLAFCLSLFFSPFWGGFLQHFCNRSVAEAEAAEGGEASPPSSAWVDFFVFAPYLARLTTSDEVRRIYRLPPVPPTSRH